MTDHKPLWQLMFNAGFDHDTAELSAAAEIEALRDWLVPEDSNLSMTAHPYTVERWAERKDLRAQLTEQTRIAREEE